MAFNENIPAANGPLTSAEIRENFQHLKNAIAKEHNWSDTDANAVTHKRGKQLFTSSGTFTVPNGITQVWVSMAGGGGGGGGSSNGLTGGTSSFGSYLSCSGGTGGTFGGTGGSSGGPGGAKGGSGLNALFCCMGGVGGGSIFGAGGAPGTFSSRAGQAASRYGAGGGGGCLEEDCGGGGGGADSVIAQLVTGLTSGEQITVIVGSGGAGGTSYGGNGSQGFVLVEW